MGTRPPRKAPGNRVVRRRLDATSVIELPREPKHPSVPNATTHAKRFVAGVTLLIVIGGLLLMMPFASATHTRTPAIDAFFTAISSISVTGLSTVNTATHWSFWGQLIILVLVQLGGFGFMVGASLVLVVIGRGLSLRDTLMMQDGSPTMSLHDVTTLTGRIIRFILISEGIGAILLFTWYIRHYSLPDAIWNSIFLAVCAFCHAGFDLHTHTSSLQGMNDIPVVIVTVGALIQLGALSYMVLSDVWTKRAWRPLRLDSKLVLITNGIMIVLASVLFIVVEWNASLSPVETEWKPLAAVFQAIAARTAGLSSVDFSQAHTSTLFLWVAVMMVGGAAGSTAGGVKLATVAVLFLAVISTLRGQEDAQAFGRRLSPALIYRAMSVFALFLTVHFILSLGLAITEDTFNSASFSFTSLMFETMSGLTTTGLSTGITPDLSIPGKLILYLAMFMGRLGPITAAYALQRRQKPARYRFPEAHIRIG
ncbi:MAG TPA: potassium transporter TrkG [Thermomicrobiales bacterium]|nr:potassium transporter TrkG [Thermomicrobiales bacterium]